MGKNNNQFINPRLFQRQKFSLNFRNNSCKKKQRRNKEEKLFKKFSQLIWSNLNVVTHNIKGCSKNQSYKLDYIANMINKQDTPTIYLIQETWMSEEKGETLINDVLFISYGYEKEIDEIRSANSGVYIPLLETAQMAWKRVGQPDPIRLGKILKTARNIRLELHFQIQKRKQSNYL